MRFKIFLWAYFIVSVISGHEKDRMFFSRTKQCPNGSYWISDGNGGVNCKIDSYDSKISKVEIDSRTLFNHRKPCKQGTVYVGSRNSIPICRNLSNSK